jgi:hypothetical protein
MSNHFGYNSEDTECVHEDDFFTELCKLTAVEEKEKFFHQDAVMRSIREAEATGLGRSTDIMRSLDNARNPSPVTASTELNEALSDALLQTRRRVISVAESDSKKILKKKSGFIMDEIKGHIKKARVKEKMRTVSYYLCDRCDKPILNSEDGFIVQGNIYVADAACRGGLIGNAFPNPAEDGSNLIDVKDINEIAFCKTCFLSALGMSPKGTRTTAVKNNPHDF